MGRAEGRQDSCRGADDEKAAERMQHRVQVLEYERKAAGSARRTCVVSGGSAALVVVSTHAAKLSGIAAG
jgi:hypothetical protein